MDLASIVSISLNQAQAAHNQLVRGSDEGALEQMQTLRDFLSAEIPARDPEKPELTEDEKETKEKQAQAIDAEDLEVVDEAEATKEVKDARTPEHGKIRPAEQPEQA